MQLIVNPGDELPIYRQIMRQIVEAIAGGRLAPAEKLPSHRDLSEQLVVAPLTVKKAYDELESLGYLETHRGRGTFIAGRLPQVDPAQQRDQVRHSARALLAQAYLAGIDLPGVIEILGEAHRQLSPETVQEENQ